MSDHPELFLNDLVRQLGKPYGFERSVKFIPGRIFPDRALISIHKSAFGIEPEASLESLLNKIKFPPDSLERLFNGLAAAEVLHFGYEATESGYIYKCYLEDVIAYNEAQRRKKSSEIPVYIAFKWSPFLDNSIRISHYRGFPSATLVNIRNIVESVYKDIQDSMCLTLIQNILASHCSNDIEKLPMVMMVNEEGNQRQSLDLNLYDCEIKVEDISDNLKLIVNYFQIPVSQWEAVTDIFKGKVLGHLSGGLDASNREFFTVYFGVEER